MYDAGTKQFAADFESFGSNCAWVALGNSPQLSSFGEELYRMQKRYRSKAHWLEVLDETDTFLRSETAQYSQALRLVDHFAVK